MKQIIFTRHAIDNLEDRGASRDEVEEAIRLGEQIPAKKGRIAFRKNFPFHSTWKGKLYESKQVMPIIVEESKKLIVITVYVFFIGGAR